MSVSPLLYHAHHIKYTEDLSFWLSIAQQQGSPILELGCGTGRVLIPMIQAGHHSFGLDHDRSMLAFLRDRLTTDQSPNAQLFQADITAYSLAIRFPFILMPCNTFSTLNRDTRRTALSIAHHHLSPDGIICVSVPNPISLAQLPPQGESLLEATFSHPLDGNPIQVNSEWEQTAQSVTIYWHYDNLLPDGRVERISSSTRHLLTTAATYKDEFTEAGYRNIKTYGDFNFKAYRPQSPYLIIVAQRG